MKIKLKNVILRDMIESDIEDYVRWFTTETKWSETDAPWEPIESDEETERNSWREYYEAIRDLPENVCRPKFELNGTENISDGLVPTELTKTTSGSENYKRDKSFIGLSASIFVKVTFGVVVSAQMLYVLL